MCDTALNGVNVRAEELVNMQTGKGEMMVMVSLIFFTDQRRMAVNRVMMVMWNEIMNLQNAEGQKDEDTA